MSKTMVQVAERNVLNQGDAKVSLRATRMHDKRRSSVMQVRVLPCTTNNPKEGL